MLTPAKQASTHACSKFCQEAFAAFPKDLGKRQKGQWGRCCMAAVINMWVGMLQEEHTRHWFCVFAVSLQTFCPQMHRVRSV